MKQNIFDNADFFERYMAYRQNPLCLNRTVEQPALFKTLPDVRGMRVLDVGCGAGDFCLAASRRGALSVTGIDISTRMCSVARQSLQDHHCSIENIAVEDYHIPSRSFDLVVSSLTLHYVADYPAVVSRLAKGITDGGHFIFTVNHPIYTSDLKSVPDYGTRDADIPLSVDLYHKEGERFHYWHGVEVLKYHRTLQTLLAELLDSGFIVKQVIEPRPMSEDAESISELQAVSRRPIFILISAQKA